jgi:hypothetical protein
MMDTTHSDQQAAQPEGDSNRQRMWRVVLVVGDIITIIVFAIIGRSSHGEAAGPAAMLDVLGTAAPFLLGWLLVAPWLGAYRIESGSEQPLGRYPVFLRRTVLAWVAAWLPSLMLRAFFLQRGIPFSFAIVTFLTNLVLLGGWRSLLFAVLAWRSRRRAG